MDALRIKWTGLKLKNSRVANMKEQFNKTRAKSVRCRLLESDRILLNSMTGTENRLKGNGRCQFVNYLLKCFLVKKEYL